METTYVDKRGGNNNSRAKLSEENKDSTALLRENFVKEDGTENP